uniref:Uncharacterized protein n=1 Tax=Musa acuminata subsp. malaccensis TaxID=214687 RepID=A0A804K7Z3_MUSAM
SPTSGSSIHPRLGEVKGGRQSIAGSKHIPFTISGKGPDNPTHQSTRGQCLTISSIYRKHTRNNQTYMCHFKRI